MSALERVLHARRVLISAVTTTALAWAGAAAATGLGVLALVDWITPLPLGLRNAALPGAAVLALVVGAAVLVRGRHARRLDRVALYLEERAPALEYSLVTALDTTGSARHQELERKVERLAPGAAIYQRALRAVAISLAGWFGALVVLLLLPAGQRERILAPRPGDLLLGRNYRAEAANRLSAIVARVTPPAYTRGPVRGMDDPATIAALVGSRIEIRGRGASSAPADSLSAQMAEGALRVAVAGDTWGVSLPMPERPVVVRLQDRGFDRLVTLEPIADAVPTVVLDSPLRDTTYSIPTGRLSLDGSARDDIGLAGAEFELMHTSGSGERFDVRRARLAAAALHGALTARLHYVLVLDTMHLGPGDVLHIRIVARDENTVSGPGEAASDTRTIRIADPRIPDTVVVVPAAVAEMDTTLISQRVLIMHAESLLVQRRRIAPRTFDDRALVLAGQQVQLRQRVEAVIDDEETITDVGFIGRTATSQILREAAAAMKEAEQELSRMQVREALAPMYRALKALERARTSNRLYLRGIFPKIVVDLDKVRLKGAEKPSVGARNPRPPLADNRRILLERVDRALALLAADPARAIDSLTMIRVVALTEAPDAAAPLLRAIDAMRAHRAAGAAVLQARRMLLRETDAAGDLSHWRGLP